MLNGNNKVTVNLGSGIDHIVVTDNAAADKAVVISGAMSQYDRLCSFDADSEGTDYAAGSFTLTNNEKTLTVTNGQITLTGTNEVVFDAVDGASYKGDLEATGANKLGIVYEDTVDLTQVEHIGSLDLAVKYTDGYGESTTDPIVQHVQLTSVQFAALESITSDTKEDVVEITSGALGTAEAAQDIATTATVKLADVVANYIKAVDDAALSVQLGTGADTITLGNGADTVQFAASGAGDHVNNFTSGAGKDVLDFSALIGESSAKAFSGALTAATEVTSATATLALTTASGTDNAMNVDNGIFFASASDKDAVAALFGANAGAFTLTDDTGKAIVLGVEGNDLENVTSIIAYVVSNSGGTFTATEVATIGVAEGTADGFVAANVGVTIA